MSRRDQLRISIQSRRAEIDRLKNKLHQDVNPDSSHASYIRYALVREHEHLNEELEELG